MKTINRILTAAILAACWLWVMTGCTTTTIRTVTTDKAGTVTETVTTTKASDPAALALAGAVATAYAPPRPLYVRQEKSSADLGQLLRNRERSLDGQDSLSRSPSLNSARRNIKGRANSGSGATKLADDNLHDCPLGLWRAGVDYPAKPHDPATGRHEADDPERLGGERHSPGGERRGALNPSVKPTDWLECHGGAGGWWGLLGGFAGGLEISERVAAGEASLVGGGEVAAGETLAVEPCLFASEIAQKRTGCFLGGGKFSGESLDFSLVNVAALALVVDGAKRCALGGGGLEVGFDFGNGAVRGVGHAQELREDFVAGENYLRKIFAGRITLITRQEIAHRWQPVANCSQSKLKP